jgi:hypothetical protein
MRNTFVAAAISLILSSTFAASLPADDPKFPKLDWEFRCHDVNGPRFYEKDKVNYTTFSATCDVTVYIPNTDNQPTVSTKSPLPKSALTPYHRKTKAYPPTATELHCRGSNQPGTKLVRKAERSTRNANPNTKDDLQTGQFARLARFPFQQPPPWIAMDHARSCTCGDVAVKQST